jgi:hypothetical protein
VSPRFTPRFGTTAADKWSIWSINEISEPKVLLGKLDVSAKSSAALRALRTSLDMTRDLATGQLPDEHILFFLA